MEQVSATAAARAFGYAMPLIAQPGGQILLSDELLRTQSQNKVHTVSLTATPNAAHEIIELATTTAEFGNLALFAATGVMFHKCNDQPNPVSEMLQRQLIQLLLLKTQLTDTEAEGVATSLFATMMSSIEEKITHLLSRKINTRFRQGNTS